MRIEFEVYKQIDLKNLEGFVLVVSARPGYPAHSQEVGRYFFKTIDDIAQWIRINYDSLANPVKAPPNVGYGHTGPCPLGCTCAAAQAGLEMRERAGLNRTNKDPDQ